MGSRLIETTPFQKNLRPRNVKTPPADFLAIRVSADTVHGDALLYFLGVTNALAARQVPAAHFSQSAFVGPDQAM
jgi:hypothetical protein